MSAIENVSREAGVGVPPRENVVRSIVGTDEVRDNSDSDGRTLISKFSVFDTWTEINSRYEGHFLERIAPGAFKKTIDENRDQIKVLYDHGHDPSVGNKPLGKVVDIREEDGAAVGEVHLFDATYVNDLVPALRSGTLGSSFRFQVVREDFDMKPQRSDYNPDGLPERTVREVRLFEFGPVTFPAYSDATAGLRSDTDRWLREIVEPSTARTSDEPEPSEATTPETTPGDEPEPSEATTHSNRGRFWFADTPAHLKRSQ